MCQNGIYALCRIYKLWYKSLACLNRASCCSCKKKNQIAMLCAFVILCLTSLTFSIPVDIIYQQKLQEWCFVQSTDVRCLIPSSKTLDFQVIREWSKRQNVPFISVTISCNEGGKVNLPWPMKAKNLISIEVHNCRLGDFYRDSYNKALDAEPDYLQYITLVNCAVEVNLHDTINRELNMHKFSRTFHCGSSVIHKMVMKNITFDVVNTNPKITKHLLNSGQYNEVVNKLENVEHIIGYTCHYNDLEIIDESIMRPRNALYFEHMTKNKIYPKLSSYNLSANSLSEFPQQLGNWSMYFPALELLDLSSNKFDNFRIAPYSFNLPIRINPLYINLQNNKFKTFPAGTLRMLLAQPAVIADLRHNPITCDCNVEELKYYLLGLQKMYPDYDFLDVTCQFPPQLKGLYVVNLDTSCCHNKS